MTTAVFSPVDRMISVVDGMLASARELCEAPWWKLTGDELLDIGRSMETLARTVWSAQVHAVDELDQTGAAAHRSIDSEKGCRPA